MDDLRQLIQEELKEITAAGPGIVGRDPRSVKQHLMAIIAAASMTPGISSDVLDDIRKKVKEIEVTLSQAERSSMEPARDKPSPGKLYQKYASSID